MSGHWAEGWQFFLRIAGDQKDEFINRTRRHERSKTVNHEIRAVNSEM